MIPSSHFKQSARNSFQAKLIYTATLTANCYEIGRAESTVKMSRMVQLFSHRTRRGGGVYVTRAIEVNRPYLIAKIVAAIFGDVNRRAVLRRVFSCSQRSGG